MNIVHAIHTELLYARELDRPVVWIRVTVDALVLSPAVVPLTPERARAAKTYVTTVQNLTGDAETIAFAHPQMERCMELIIHPEDYMRLLKDLDPYTVNAVLGQLPTGVRTVFGVPVKD